MLFFLSTSALYADKIKNDIEYIEIIKGIKKIENLRKKEIEKQGVICQYKILQSENQQEALENHNQCIDEMKKINKTWLKKLEEMVSDLSNK